MLDVARVREDFPLLKTGIVYLDSVATSLTPRQVVEAMDRYYAEYRANVGRGIYELARRASEAYEEARRAVAKFINAEGRGEVVMVKNTTEAINLVAHSLKWRKGDKVVTTLLEHHSNYLPWLKCAQRYGVKVEVVRPSREGFLDLGEVERVVDDNTRLVAVTHVSNVLGVVTPVKEIAEIAHEHGALMLVDGAQSVPHFRVDVSRLKCDFLAFSGHKMCGPTGSGGLFIGREAWSELDPVFIGGGTVEEVDVGSFALLSGPARFEAGTPMIAEAIGLRAAVEYLERLGMDSVEEHERRLGRRLHEGLAELPGVEVYGPEPRYKLGITSFNVEGLDPHEVAMILDASRIAVRSGMHCAQPLIKRVLGLARGTVRASVYLYNTEEDVERLLSAVEELARSVGRHS
ncbi:MAG: cysteine desulfurase [Thermoprotei archaeon]|nr:MAG: cysteine desulfurase [Thermoprotei archaeon]